jgi:DNA adenine methylase
LITYDDAPKIRELFSFANIFEWDLQYGIYNYMQEHANNGKELMRYNYDIDSLDKPEFIDVPEKQKIASLDHFLK